MDQLMKEVGDLIAPKEEEENGVHPCGASTSSHSLMFSWYFFKYGFLLDFVIPTLRWVVLLLMTSLLLSFLACSSRNLSLPLTRQ